jgi:hypothetical protein
VPPFLPADFKEQAGKIEGVHNHVRDLSVALGVLGRESPLSSLCFFFFLLWIFSFVSNKRRKNILLQMPNIFCQVWTSF